MSAWRETRIDPDGPRWPERLPATDHEEADWAARSLESLKKWFAVDEGEKKMSTADDFAIVEARVKTGFHAWHTQKDAIEAFERIKAGYQKYLDACSRVTELANDLHKNETDQPFQNAPSALLRDALGPAYLGGPLL